MAMKTLSQVRQTFLEYFKEHGHAIVPSSSLVPHHDPSLLFTNAGMVPFKNVFTGVEKPPFNRLTSAQKCVRAGGKHNDLENVGHTARHHTFFEMLGNFSFGDYFKEGAIDLAWTFVTKTLGLPDHRLWVTFYAEDEEAAQLWKKISGLPDHRIIPIATTDNFWSMGATGPCGPCSEIFYDHGEGIFGGPPGSLESHGDRFVEIWNLVFMSYEQVDAQTRRPLSSPCIDTGMGLERISAILQGVHDTYETDLFKTLIEAIANHTQTPPSVSHRVIADHLRSGSFLIADGVTPSNEGRGYVLRRILRRAMRHGHGLGCQDPLLYKIAPTLIQEMGSAYPELQRVETLILETLRLEEERFKGTLEKGLKLLDEAVEGLAPQAPLPGDVAFKLYDTYGFPLDLTQDILKSQGRLVEEAGFHEAMHHQKTLARASWVGSGQSSQESLWFHLKESFGPTTFLGYDTLCEDAQVQAILHKGEQKPRANPGETVQVLMDQTPFYGESGGQEGDRGEAYSQGHAVLTITTTLKKLGILHIHQGLVTGQGFQVGDRLKLHVDASYRQGLKAHHSATHLLHAILRSVLGPQVMQKGSLVTATRLRFDFSYPHALSQDLLHTIEDQMNAAIRCNKKASTQHLSLEKALESGALGLFGEKYDSKVRVVSFQGQEGTVFSAELCGGTHVDRTGDIGFFKILSETGIAAGVRRLEAVAGSSAEKHLRNQEILLNSSAHLLKVKPEELPCRLEALLKEKKKLQKALKDSREQSPSSDPVYAWVKEIRVVSQSFETLNPPQLKSQVDLLKKKIQSGVVLVGGTWEGKNSLVIGVTPDLTHSVNAVTLVQQGTPLVGGKGGGGRPDLAQAGGTGPVSWPEVFSALQRFLETAV